MDSLLEHLDERIRRIAEEVCQKAGAQCDDGRLSYAQIVELTGLSEWTIGEAVRRGELEADYPRPRWASRAGIKARVTPYTLRYSFATLALLAGELDAAVSKQMGLARVDFTKTVYVKLLPEMQQSLSGSFERLLSETGGNQLAHTDAPGVM